MPFSFVLKKEVPPPEPEWVSIFDNTYWGPYSNANWNGSQWVVSGEDSMIIRSAIGTTWAEGFRPTKIRISGTANPVDTVELRYGTSGEAVIGKVYPPWETPLEIDLDWSANQDLFLLILAVISPVTNIEFLGGTLG